MKTISVVILCIIVLVQYVAGVRSSIRSKAGCLGAVLFTVWTAFLLLLFWFAGVFDFK